MRILSGAGDAAQDSPTSRGFQHIQRHQRRSADKLRDGLIYFTIFLPPPGNREH